MVVTLKLPVASGEKHPFTLVYGLRRITLLNRYVTTRDARFGLQSLGIRQSTRPFTYLVLLTTRPCDLISQEPMNYHSMQRSSLQ